MPQIIQLRTLQLVCTWPSFSITNGIVAKFKTNCNVFGVALMQCDIIIYASRSFHIRIDNLKYVDEKTNIQKVY